MRPLRILLVTTGMRLGGAERQIQSLATEFLRRGQSVALLNLTGRSELALPEGVHELRLCLKAHRLPLDLCRAARWIRRWQPDVVHSHMLKANLITRLLRLLAPMPRLICTAHSQKEGGRLMMWAYRASDGLCNLSTHVSAQAVAHYLDLGAMPAGKLVHMPNGVDLQGFSPDPDARPGQRQALGLLPEEEVWLHVARLVPVKAQSLLLQAFARVHAQNPKARLLICGDGPLRAELQAQAEGLGLSQVVRFLGQRSDVPALMNACDAFVLSSDTEGAPLVLAEAQALGLPCVSTEVSGARELLTPHDRIVPVQDMAALVRAMQALASNPISAAHTALERRTHIQAVADLRHIAERWLHLYQGTTSMPLGHNPHKP